MAKIDNLKMFVFLTPEDIKPTAKAGRYDVRVKMGHNHDEPDKEIPTKVFIQNTPVGMIQVKGDTEHTFKDVRLDAASPIKVRIVRAGQAKDAGDEIEVPAQALAEPPPATKTDKKPDIEIRNPPRDPDPTTGMFILTVLTRKNGKDRNRKFTVLSSKTLDIRQQTAAGITPVTKFTSTRTGMYILYVDFPGNMAKVVLRLDDGTEVVTHLRK